MILQVFYAFLSTLGFTVILNIERKKAAVASAGGALSWLVYLLVYKGTDSDTASLFAASLAMGTYSEIMARVFRSPATVFYIPGFIPLVPGATVYYSVYAFVHGNNSDGMNFFIQTILKSASITLGLIFSGALTMIILNAKKRNFIRVFKPHSRNTGENTLK